MAFRTIEVEGLGSVRLAKRRGTRHLRLSVSHDGRVRVSIPSWMPYATGLAFIHKHRQWVDKQRHGRAETVLRSGQRIGPLRLTIHEYQKTARRSRISSAMIEMWTTGSALETDFQAKARRVCERALTKHAETVLPSKLENLSHNLGYRYKSLKIKKLSSRWGSCSSHNDITLNIFLLQLPPELVDYVLVHELVHTKHAHHGQSFWAAMKKALPTAMDLRKALRRYPPALLPEEDAYVS